jgi:hypothetical protein
MSPAIPGSSMLARKAPSRRFASRFYAIELPLYGAEPSPATQIGNKGFPPMVDVGPPRGVPTP